MGPNALTMEIKMSKMEDYDDPILEIDQLSISFLHATSRNSGGDGLLSCVVQPGEADGSCGRVGLR